MILLVVDEVHQQLARLSDSMRIVGTVHDETRHPKLTKKSSKVDKPC